jgi:hypothetical protein
MVASKDVHAGGIEELVGGYGVKGPSWADAMEWRRDEMERKRRERARWSGKEKSGETALVM